MTPTHTPSSRDPNSHHRPTNTYYSMPNYHRILGTYAITGLFACAHITSSPSTTPPHNNTLLDKPPHYPGSPPPNEPIPVFRAHDC
ncbi:uncharacterized protein ASPGLDRAFT_44881 [Aspergillus glaucus CBS 516.65]|uniref:Uncharacterized protein n=1 Tax=Aspergillus glaucus CBS 516.65 TaxID=1160497 RepID=A0A1L9VPQ5_ASPGL|nr:hypothetical protein ASPGLDRAFT_44881 [Aspergillus glaucus CBS 516.65]OJJ85908.1 hypothetical protein ASPGLDRAFT_44881 [Aspergillus glaucus CBS 516.65]